MIIYGHRSTDLKGESNVDGYKCTECGKNDTTVLSFVSRYVHVFWIPIFSFGKYGVAVCGNCQKVTEKKDMTTQLLERYVDVKNSVRIPFWHFSGVGLVLFMIVLGSFSSYSSGKAELEYLADPKVGDVYGIESYESDDYYTAFKVVGVNDDNVVVYPNQYEIDGKYDLEDIDITANYIAEEEFEISRALLLERYETGELYDVYR